MTPIRDTPNNLDITCPMWRTRENSFILLMFLPGKSIRVDMEPLAEMTAHIVPLLEVWMTF
jgi:hypothetical protein